MNHFSSVVLLAAVLSIAGCGGDATVPGEDAGRDSGVDAGLDAAVVDGAPRADLGVDLGFDGGGSCDADGDGHDASSCGGDDCDDGDPDRFPANPERCDAAGHDEDCNPATLGVDRDADGFPGTTCCSLQDTGALLCGLDCDDTSPDIRPTAPESCNGIDDNCNGAIDEGVLSAWYIDADGDGYGAMGTTMIMMSCTRPSGYASTSDDCNDARADAHPGGTEVCDGIDNTCDGSVDIGCMCTVGMSRMCGATMPSGGFYMAGPCHPGSQACAAGVWGPCVGNVDPGPSELCTTTSIDDNCNGVINEPAASDAIDWYPDEDADGYGNRTASAVRQCLAPPGRVSDHTDCVDSGAGAAGIHPGAPEACDGIDNNCIGGIDELPAAAGSCALGTAVATATCTSAMCAVATCNASTGDCDRIYTNGCEVNLAVTTANCGTCGRACLFACTASNCDAIVSIGAGGQHTCAVRASGQVGCWGLGGQGQLGDGMSRSYNAPTPISAAYLTDATTVSGGALHTCALRTGGAVSCWGQNIDGQLGTGDSTSWNAPRAINPVSLADARVLALSPNGNVSCAIRATGQAKCWGRNIAFQVGDGTFNGTNPAQRFVDATPVNVFGLSSAIAIAPGTYHTCAIRTGGQAVCWGSNAGGQLGDGVLAHSVGAVREGCVESTLPFVSSPLLPAAGGYIGDAASGITFRSDCHNAPVNVSGLVDAIAITSGDNHSCAIRTGGQVVCWGYNGEGELGPGTPAIYLATPIAVTGLTNAIAVAAAGGTTCAIRTGGQVVCWGDNNAGQLGNGTTGSSSSALVNVTGLTNAMMLTAGDMHFCAVRTTGQPVCWGLGFNGQLGTGAVIDHNTPVNVLPLP